jgi:hypothetical protein
LAQRRIHVGGRSHPRVLIRSTNIGLRIAGGGPLICRHRRVTGTLILQGSIERSKSDLTSR